MKRISANRFLFVLVICALAGTGCATRGGTDDDVPPDPVPSATVADSPAVSDNDATVDTATPDAPTQNDLVAADAPAETVASAGETETPPGEALTTSPDTPLEDSAESTAAAMTVDRPTYEEQRPCYQPVEETAGWLDKGQVQVYQSVCGTVAWFDGFFGNRRYDSASRETTGRISVSGFYDQYDGFDPRLRFRAKFALPALNDRANVMIGRGDEREMIEGQKQTPSDSIPSNFNRVEDDSFMVGLGYQKGTGLKRGFDFTLGVRKFPPEPFVRGRYRRAWELSESTLFRLTPVIYWKYDEGIGATLSGNIDHLLTDRLMFRWSGSGNISQDNEVEGVAWNSWLSLFQALADRKAISYHTFVIGETKAEVQKQNFGAEVRYRRRILRKWLFLDLVSSVSWPRYFLEEEREINFGFGAGFEMYFGPVPDALLR